MAEVGIRSRVTGAEAITSIIDMLKDEELFIRGYFAGVESETFPGREPDPMSKDSPITLLAQMPAWEGSHRSRGFEQDLKYSIGAVIGAFATRAGLDDDSLRSRMGLEI